MRIVNFSTPNDAQVVSNEQRNLLTPSDALLIYFNVIDQSTSP